LDFSRLQAPAESGGVLVEPAAPQIAALVRSNRHDSKRHTFTLGQVGVGEARTALRAAHGCGDRPVIVTGHQPEFIHAGVWAKHVVAARLAEALDGVAVNLVVDHDAPASLSLNAPLLTDGGVRLTCVRYADWPHGAAIEGMPPADAHACDALHKEMRAALGPLYVESMLPRFFEVYSQGVGAPDWVEQAVAARRSVEQELGVHVDDRRVSALWCGPLLSVLIGDAWRMAADYNAALAEYRRRYRVRGAHRPIPDLHIAHDECETALWVYRSGEPRRRLFVRRSGSALQLCADRDAICELDPASVGDWSRLSAELKLLSPWRIRPRALMLTLWARLLFADLFIHGIGGAKYDRITDDIIRRFFGIAPPAMACVSATLRLPIANGDASVEGLRRARWRMRDVHFNPQRYLTPDTGRARVTEKEALIAESLRLRRDHPADHRARRTVFARIRALNAELGESARDAAGRIGEELSSREHADLLRQVAGKRDFFFAMHRRGDLRQLLANLPDVTQFSRATIV